MSFAATGATRESKRGDLFGLGDFGFVMVIFRRLRRCNFHLDSEVGTGFLSVPNDCSVAKGDFALGWNTDLPHGRFLRFHWNFPCPRRAIGLSREIFPLINAESVQKSGKRQELQRVPSIDAETVQKFEISQWFGVFTLTTSSSPLIE